MLVMPFIKLLLSNLIDKQSKYYILPCTLLYHSHIWIQWSIHFNILSSKISWLSSLQSKVTQHRAQHMQAKIHSEHGHSLNKINTKHNHPGLPSRRRAIVQAQNAIHLHGTLKILYKPGLLACTKTSLQIFSKLFLTLRQKPLPETRKEDKWFRTHAVGSGWKLMIGKHTLRVWV